MTDPKALTITEHLPVKLTDGRRLALGCEVAEQIYEENKQTIYLANIKKAVTQKINEAVHRRNIAAEALHQGFEMVDVPIENKVEGTKLVTYRLDDGTVVRERALTVEELKESRKVRT